ncbi:hypothetical protein [Bdellovibrio reynosensis]|uniref:DUF5666 domain-containing protein n=1 Tax=Bdellovibrio reynosensis TaxID=2835041 RepID=A0ABY4C6B8_9BACT|nr:hypothetical protein [Bdellovibrio reynosensis]UOF00249.1 hypothetical protein MNR06_11110 [Bdellovibrio reynosensis]
MWNRTTLTVLSLGLAVGVFGGNFFLSKNQSERKPSSVTHWKPAPMGKHLALLKVEIAQPEIIPEEGSEEVTLLGRILVNQKMDSDLTYSWTLPEGVEVIEGNISDTLSSVHTGQIVEVRLVVSGFNREKQRLISLEANGAQGTRAMGNSAVLASRPEETFEAVAPELKKSAEEQLGTEFKSRR